jgi:uncharacterized membrane protein
MSDEETTRGGAPTVQLASPAAEEYLGGVRAALADLPAPEVAEILDDVRAHLADLTDELGGKVDAAALTARLGSPGAYAAELRAAAGYPAAVPGPAAEPRHGLARLAVAGLVGAPLLVLLGIGADVPVILLFGLLFGVLALLFVVWDGPAVPSVAALPEVRRLVAARPAEGTTARAVTDFVASLQPAWWVARAVAAAVLLVQLIAAPDAAPGVLLVVLVAVPVSVWVGHRTRRDRRWLWAVVPLNALAALVLLWLFTTGLPQSSDSSPSASYPAYQPGLWQDSEWEIRDIRPVDAAGNPLTDVYLFDQDGRAIDTAAGEECAGDGEYGGDGVESEPEGIAPYPRGTWEYDLRTGHCRLVPPGPLVVAVPATSVPDAGVTTAPPTPVLVPPPVGSVAPPPGAPASPVVPATPAPPTR